MSRAAATAAFFLVLSAGYGLLSGFGGGGDPRAAAVDLTLDRGPATVLVLGNSVTQSAIDADALATALGLPPSGVAGLATEGAGPATWLASWDHARREGQNPAVVLLYVPFGMIVAPEPVQEGDLALLTDLDAPPAAWTLAGHTRPDAWVRLQTARYRLRERALAALTAGLVDRLVPTPDGRPASKLARGTLFVEARPNEHAAMGPRLEGESLARAAATTDDRVVPAILAMAAESGSRLVVVQPAVNPEGRPGACGPAVVAPALEAALLAGPADVLDLAAFLREGGDFTTHHHLSATGRAKATAAVAAGLRAIDAARTPAAAAGRRWSPGCG